MDDEADAAREYERLRAELADFVLGALAERIAQGQQPQLSQALAEAIDRRVEEAVAARVGGMEFPDPDSFADSVIAAAAGRGGGSSERAESGASRARGSSRSGGSEARSRAHEPRRTRRLSGGQVALIAIIGLVIVGAAAFFLMRGWNDVAANTITMNALTRAPEVTPDGYNAQQQPPAGNTATPGSAGAPENVQGTPR